MTINKKNNNKYYIITIFIIIIFFSLTIFSKQISTMINHLTKVDKTIEKENLVKEKLKITVIDDKRCINCNTKKLVFQLKQAPELNNAIFNIKDFSDKQASKIINENNIKYLPAFIFSKNNVNKDLSKFLKKTVTGKYILNTGANFDPFLKRSDKGFLFIKKSELDNIKKDSYMEGNKKIQGELSGKDKKKYTEAKITWLEYSDLECPYCARLHNSDVNKSLKTKYGNNINKIFNHFPLEFHKNAVPGAEILECTGEQKGSDTFYKLIDISYSNKNSNKNFLINEAVKLGANKQKLEECVNNNKYSNKIDFESKRGADLFGITGTPGNILINNETLEYYIISGAYPKETFIKIIDKLLK